MYKMLLQFKTEQFHNWVITKTFNDLSHCNNFIEYIHRTKGYMLDELWHKGGYPFKEGDDYWTIEDGVVVYSCWDEQSEEMFNPYKIYFTSESDANKYLIS